MLIVRFLFEPSHGGGGAEKDDSLANILNIG